MSLISKVRELVAAVVVAAAVGGGVAAAVTACFFSRCFYCCRCLFGISRSVFFVYFVIAVFCTCLLDCPKRDSTRLSRREPPATVGFLRLFTRSRFFNCRGIFNLCRPKAHVDFLLCWRD